MAKKPYFSEREVRLARSFIHAIGGNEKNGYLLLAVIAWQRAMGKNHETFWKSLSRYNAYTAGQKLAAKLKQRIQLDGKHFKGILAALRRNGKSAGYVEQARDFMVAIEQSNWDRQHYGYKAYEAGHWKTEQVWHQTGWASGYWETKVTWVPEQQEYDPLAITWAKLTGHNIPKAYFQDSYTVMPTQPKQRDPHQQPRSLVHVQGAPNYIQPYAARDFYQQRPHLGANILPE